MTILGNALQQTGDFQQAEACYRKAAEIRKVCLLFIIAPSTKSSANTELTPYAHLTTELLYLQDILSRDHLEHVVLLNNLSVAMHKNGRNAKAEILQRRALEIGREKLGPRHDEVVPPTLEQNHSRLYLPLLEFNRPCCMRSAGTGLHAVTECR